MCESKFWDTAASASHEFLSEFDIEADNSKNTDKFVTDQEKNERINGVVPRS